MNVNKLKVKGIFLDLDGTIVDSKEAYIEAAKIAFKAIGQKAPEDKVALEIPKRLEQGLTISDITKGDSKKFLKIYYQTFYSISHEKTKLIPNVSATLETLSQKAKLALITMRYAPSASHHKRARMFWHFKIFYTCGNSYGYLLSPSLLLKR